LNDRDTAILDSVWSAFEKIAAEFPGDAAVLMTKQYHGWHSAQRLRLSQCPDAMPGSTGDAPVVSSLEE
jgi:hypothetical protein